MTAGGVRDDRGSGGPGPGRPDPGAPDVAALRRRVLVAGAVTMALFLAAAYAVTAVGAAQGWLAVVMALVWVTVTRPLMRPVRDVTRLRRRLAYQAFQDHREQEHREQEQRGQEHREPGSPEQEERP